MSLSIQQIRREIALPGLWHDYANLFPMLDASGQDALRADIQRHGVREPVVLFQGRILDGRNRYMAARDLGLDFPVVDFDGTEAEALAYVLSTNLHRRHLTESQRAAVAAKLANMRQGERTDLQHSANLLKVSQAEAADMLNVSERSVTTAKKVIEQGTPELIAAVEQGEVSVSAAAVVSELPPEEQAATVSEGPKAVRAKAKDIRKEKAIPAEDQPATDPEAAKVVRELAELTREGVEQATEAKVEVERVAEATEAQAVPQKPAKPNDPPEVSDLRQQFRDLTPEAQEDDFVSLHQTVREKSREIAALKEEIAKRDAWWNASEGDKNRGRSFAIADHQIKTAEGRMAEYQRIAAKAEREVRHLRKRVAELEVMGIEIPI